MFRNGYTVIRRMRSIRRESFDPIRSLRSLGMTGGTLRVLGIMVLAVACTKAPTANKRSSFNCESNPESCNGGIDPTTAGSTLDFTVPETVAANTDFTISWGAVPSAEKYDLLIGNDEKCADVVIALRDLTTTSQKISMTNVGTFYACLEAKNSTGIVLARKQGYKFNVTSGAAGFVAASNLRIGADSASATTHSSTDDDTTIYFIWDAATDGTSGIKSYSVQHYAGANCLGTETKISAGSTTSYTFSSAAYSSTYSFNVTSTNNANESKTSDCSNSITINYPTHTITFDTPANYTYDNTILSVSGGVATLLAVTQTYDDNTSSEFGLTKAHNNTTWDTDHLELKNAGAPDPRPLPNDFYYGVDESNLELLIHFDDPYIVDNDTVTEEVNGLTATLSNNNTGVNKSVKGKHGRAKYFDGINDFLFVNHDTRLNSLPFTISLWFKSSNPLDLLTKGPFGSPNGSFGLGIGTSFVGYYAKDASNYTLANTTQNFSDGEWHFCQYVVDSSGSKLYVDGVEVGSGGWTGTAGAVTNTNNIHIGTYQAVDFEGSIDELAIFSRALSATEIATLYQNQVKSFTHEHWAEAPGLMDGNVLLLHLEETSGNMIDHSGLGFDATIGGSPSLGITGKINNGVYFSSPSHNLRIAHSDVFNTDIISASIWINFNVDTWNPVVFQKGTESWKFDVGNGTQKMAFSVQINSTTRIGVPDPDLLVTGQWQHYVGTFDGTDLKLYRNGVEVNSVPLVATIYDNTDDLVLSAADGSLDEAAVWNRVLSPQEIQTIYNLQSGNYRGNVHELPNDQDQTIDTWFPMNGNVLLVHMNETSIKDSGTNPAVYDYSGNGLNGDYSSGDDGLEKSSQGHLGGALTFDGTDDCVKMAGSTKLDPGTNDFTISAWFKTSADYSAAFGVIYDDEDSISLDSAALVIRWDNRLEATIGDGSLVISPWMGGPTVNDGKWHFATVVVDLPSQAHLYLDGRLISSDTDGPLASLTFSNDRNPSIGCASSASANYFNGSIDELAIWNRALSEDEIRKIYDHQSAKYSGTFTSDVIDTGSTSASWTTLAWDMIRPYGKELLGNSSSDLSSSYTALPNDTLMNGNVLLMHFNETAEDTVNGNTQDIEDFSGQNNHGDTSGSPTYKALGKFGYAMEFDGTDDYVHIADPNETINALSFWFKPASTLDTSTSGQHTIGFRDAGSTDIHVCFGSCTGQTTNEVITLYSGTNAGSPRTYVKSILISGGEWHHFLMVWNSGNNRYDVYLNGVAQTMVPDSNGDLPQLTDYDYVRVGHLTGGGYFKGLIDEVAIWNRALSASEISELYRRGASRVRYKVRTCDASGCDDEPWIVPDNTLTPYSSTGEFFSELHNTTTSNPSLTFGGFGSHTVSNNQFFQWKAYLDTTDTAEIPELKSVTVGPTHYYGGNPTIVTSNALSFSSLVSFTETSSVGTMKYQLSNDGGTTWYWYNSGWTATTASYAESTAATDINTNIGTFPVGSGSLQVKAFLNSAAAAQATSLENVSVQYVP